MAYRPHATPAPLLFGYDPVRDLHPQHLARLVEHVVEASLAPKFKPNGPGQRAFDPRLCAKVLVYGYATGTRSSRQLERLCQESLPYLFLTRGDAPSYRTLCSFRVHHSDLIEEVWIGLFAVAEQAGIVRLGRIVVDSTKIRADAGPEAVVKKSEYEAVLSELRQIFQEAEAADASEEQESPGTTQLEKTVDTDQMRDILRRVRKQRARSKSAEASAPDRNPLGPRMLPRIEEAIAAIESAQEEGRAHACVTDPDARMMGEGREKRVRECHSYEVAIDNDLLVVGQTCQSAVDNPRLIPLVEAAKKHEPDGIKALDGDSGYYSGDTVADLIESGIDVCIPTSHTACDLHRGQPVGTTRTNTVGSVLFTYDKETNQYTCPEGNVLTYRKTSTNKGQEMRLYTAENSCKDCPLRASCGNRPTSTYRTLSVGIHHELLHANQQRFAEPEHGERYHRRAHAVETRFGFLRGVLGYARWMLRGAKRVEAEARLFTTALQIRKIHSCLTKA
jgi:transposase